MNSLTRFDRRFPFPTMRSMMESMRDWMDRPLPFFDLALPFEGETAPMALNVTEHDKVIVVEALLPGVSEDQLDINIAGNVLSITAEAREEREEEEKGRHMREWRYGKFARSVQLPAEVETKDAQADLENGVLKIRLPKTTPSGAQKITVKGQKLLKEKSK